MHFALASAAAPWPLALIVNHVLVGKPLPPSLTWIGALYGADSARGLLAWLAGATVGPEEAGDIKWNFGKFLVGKDGNVRARFAPQTEPCAGEVKQAIDAALAEQS